MANNDSNINYNLIVLKIIQMKRRKKERKGNTKRQHKKTTQKDKPRTFEPRFSWSRNFFQTSFLNFKFQVQVSNFRLNSKS